MRDYLFSKREKENKLVYVSKEKSWSCFLIGWIGLTIIANICYLIIKNFSGADLEDAVVFQTVSAYVNVISYLLVLTCLCLVLQRTKLIEIIKQYKNLNHVLEGIGLGFLLIFATIVYNTIVSNIFPWYGSNENQESVESFITLKPLLSFFLIVLLAPICEEITYRLSLFGVVYKYNRILAYIVTILLFALIHSAFFTTENLTKELVLNELVNLPSYMIAGGILCYSYEKNGSLATSITAHMTNNLVSFIATMLASSAAISIH